jgi:hypothetical protein
MVILAAVCAMVGLFYTMNRKIPPNDSLVELKAKFIRHYEHIGLVWFGFAILIYIVLYVKG